MNAIDARRSGPISSHESSIPIPVEMPAVFVGTREEDVGGYCHPESVAAHKGNINEDPYKREAYHNKREPSHCRLPNRKAARGLAALLIGLVPLRVRRW